MKRICSLTLVFFMLLSAMSCGSDKPVGDNTTDAPQTEPEETKREITDDLGDIRFDGREFTMYLAHPVGDYIMEEETGDTLDDTVYARNREVEERLGIKLNYIESGFQTDGANQTLATAAIKSFIMAGDDSNDVYLHVQHSGMPGLIAEGNFVDWNTVDNVNLTKPYWYQNCIRDINYGNKIFGMTGSYNLSTLTSANCLFFNKRLMEENNMEYPYKMVLDGTWTIDKFIEMIKNGTRDLNGDTKIDFENDQIGYWGWGYESVPAMFMGMGGDVLLKDKNNLPALNIENERTVFLVDKMIEVFALDGAARELTTYGIFNTLFQSGQLLFVHGSLSLATTLRNMTDDFGFIPYPKLDVSQVGYNCRVQNTSGLTYIPVTNNDLPFTGAVLEVMSAVSYNTVVPAYFDVVLTVKATRDTESEEMVPIIRDSASFYDEAGGFNILTMLNSGQALSTYWATVKNKVEENVQNNIIDIYID